MGFLKRLLGVPDQPSPPSDPRFSTDEEIDAIFRPLGTQVCDFKDATNLSWAYIMPTVQDVCVQLFVQARGRESTLRLLEYQLRGAMAEGGVSETMINNHSNPKIPPECTQHVADLKVLLWKFASEATARGCPAEHVAQACAKLVVVMVMQAIGANMPNQKLGEQASQALVAGLAGASYRALQAGTLGK